MLQKRRRGVRRGSGCALRAAKQAKSSRARFCRRTGQRRRPQYLAL